MFVNASPPVLSPILPILTEVSRIDSLIECCVEHILFCKQRDPKKKTSFSDGVVYGDGMSRQVLCKQCNHCGIFVFCNTTTKLVLPGTKSARSLMVSTLVFGAMTAGLGFADINTLFSSIGLPSMDQKTFYNTTEMWGKKLWDFWEINRKIAHDAEISLARAAGDVDFDDCPLLCVTADGGWFTRCNRGHTYKSKTGCQVIRGIATQACLYISVKNSYCAFCHYHDKRNPTIPEHTCYKNHVGPPQQMEQQGIVDGFLAGFEDFGCKYSVLVADGDSSTFPNLVCQCPWPMKKCPCVNHFHKCTRSRLEKAILTQEFTKQKWHLLFPSALCIKLCKSIKAACRMAIVTVDKTKAEVNLKRDLLNAPLHVLGFHEGCRVEFCLTARQLRPDEAVPAQPTFRLPTEEIGKLSTCVKTFLEANWEEKNGVSLDSTCNCNKDGDCICDVPLNLWDDSSDTEEDETMLSDGANSA